MMLYYYFITYPAPLLLSMTIFNTYDNFIVLNSQFTHTYEVGSSNQGIKHFFFSKFSQRFLVRVIIIIS